MRILVNGDYIGNGFNLRNTFNLNKTEVIPFNSRYFMDDNFFKNKNWIYVLDKQIGYIKKNKKMYMRLVLILALIIPATTLNAFALGAGTETFMGSEFGREAYRIGKYVAQGVCLVGWLIEIIKSALNGTIDNVGKVSVKWVSFGLIVKFLPSVVTWIFEY